MASPTELSEQIEVVRCLRAAGVLFAAVPNGGRRDRREAALLKKSGVRAGVPDLLIFDSPPMRPQKRGVALEMKREGASPSAVSPAQREWLDALSERGWVGMVGRGAADALKQLRELGYVL